MIDSIDELTKEQRDAIHKAVDNFGEKVGASVTAFNIEFGAALGVSADNASAALPIEMIIFVFARIASALIACGNETPSADVVKTMFFDAIDDLKAEEPEIFDKQEDDNDHSRH